MKILENNSCRIIITIVILEKKKYKLRVKSTNINQ